MLELYTDITPNGFKVSIALEEMGLEYNLHGICLGGEQTTPEFTEMNPNQKIPVLVDDGVVFTESTAILIYLAEKTGMFLPHDPFARAEVFEALMFQTSSLGPMFEQYLVFAMDWRNDLPKVTNRYFDEVSRIMGVLNTQLEGEEYLAGGQYSIADIAMIPWIRLCTTHPACRELPLKGNVNLRKWWARVSTRPEVQKGFLVSFPEKFTTAKKLKNSSQAVTGFSTIRPLA